MYLAIAFTKEKMNFIYTVRACVNTVEGGEWNPASASASSVYPPRCYNLTDVRAEDAANNFALNDSGIDPSGVTQAMLF